MGTFRVYGVPACQGSVRAFVVKGTGRAIVAQGGSSARRASLGAWRQSLAEAARGRGAELPLWPSTLVPVRVSVTFYLPRPASLPKRIQRPAKRPDLDKLLRAVLDALTGIAWQDDGQVVTFGDVRKEYATPAEPPGALVRVELEA